MLQMPATGGCLWGAARYEVRGPLRDVVICHCSRCLRTHGHVAAYAACARLLSPAHTLVYFLLRTGLPDHVVFAHVTLRAVIEAAAGLNAYMRNEQMRRLSWQALDFVVCDRNLRPLAVIEVVPREEQQEAAAMRKSWIESAGLRYVELDQTALPRKEAMRALVVGDAEVQQKSGTAGEANVAANTTRPA